MRVDQESLPARLLAPVRTLTPEALAGAWFMARIEARCRGAAALAADPRACGWLRGAVGAALGDAASAEARDGLPCPWSPPCALDALFRVQGRVTGGLEIPKPYVTTLDAEGDDLVAGLVLFGFATDWADSAADALVRGLRAGLGPRGRPLDPVARRIVGQEGLPLLDPGPPPHVAELRFRTPCVLRQGDRAHLAPASLLKSLADRVSGLARWHDAALEADFRRLADDAEALAARIEAAREVAWRRGSRRQDAAFRVAGFSGSLTLAGDLTRLAPFLAIGAACHVGGRTTLGMGRYDLALIRPQ